MKVLKGCWRWELNMNVREALLILSHLFRKRGSPVLIDEAVEYLSFKWRYGKPSSIRRLLTFALQNELISREGNFINSEFLYDRQVPSPNQTDDYKKGIRIGNIYEALR